MTEMPLPPDIAYQTVKYCFPENRSIAIAERRELGGHPQIRVRLRRRERQGEAVPAAHRKRW